MPLHGIIPPMVTPLESHGAVDKEGTERLVEHLVGGGVHGIFVLGTTGEGPSLARRVQRQLIETTVRQVENRIPVLVAVTDTCLAESLSLAEVAAELGAFAVVASAPFYFQIAQPELQDYLRELVDEVPLPLVLYNMPGLTKVSLEPDTVRMLLDHQNVIGIKDSSGDIDTAAEYVKLIADRPDWTLMTGPEELLADALRIGVKGGVCGGANLFPRLFVDLYEAAVRDDYEQVRTLHESILKLGRLLYGIGQHGSAYIKGIKCALSCLGICEDHMALPLHRFEHRERQIVKQRLKQFGQLDAAGVRSVIEGYLSA